MNPIPQTATEESKNVARTEGNHEEGAGGYGVERPDDIDRPDHVRPEKKIYQGLRPAGSDKPRPNQMPSTD